jgi:NitT/TauT family transport system substrate-binding protein
VRARASVAVLLAVASVLLAGCGGSGSSAGPSKADPVKITVANLAVTNSAGLVLGVEKGFFTDAGLEVTLKDTPAASTVPAVVSGGAQFGFTGVPPLVNARASGLPIKAVAPAAGYPKDLSKSQIRLMAPKGSAVTDVRLLEGKKVAVDTLYQLPHLSLIRALQARGVDTSKVKFVEVPYPAMLDALASGKVDAADLGDPFLTQALAAGDTPLVSNGMGFAPGVTQVIWISSEKYISQHPKVVQAFAAAIKKSNAYAQAHPDEVRKIVPTYMKGTEPIASTILLPEYTTAIDTGVFGVYENIMSGLGQIKKKVSASDAVYQP